MLASLSLRISLRIGSMMDVFTLPMQALATAMAHGVPHTSPLNGYQAYHLIYPIVSVGHLGGE